MKPSTRPGFSVDSTRREILKGLAGLGAVGTIFSRALYTLAQTTGTVSSDMIRQAEWIAGVSFTDAEREMMLADLADLEKGFVELRKIALDNAVPPALGFQPIAPPPAISRENSKAPFPVMSPAKGKAAQTPADLAFASISELAGWLRTRKVSPVELMTNAFRRIEQLDPQLKAIITQTRELAEKQARAAERDFQQRQIHSPLQGIVWGAKDLIAVPGYPTTWGSPIYKTQVRPEHATVSVKLEKAGAVLVGKTSVGELAMGDVWFGGTTRNPWNIAQGSSGSSAGSASGTAAGLFTFGIGTETLGSIVSPSTRCGVTGLRPTFGRVSRFGIMALAWSMDKAGVIARSAEDCAFVFSAIHGSDPLDSSAQSAPFGFPSVQKLKSIRVGFVEKAFEDPRFEDSPVPVPSERKAEVLEQLAFDRQTLDVLRRLGVNLIPIKLPERIPMSAMFSILTAEAATAFDELVRTGKVSQMVDQTAQAWPNTFRQGQLIPAVEYLRANRVRCLLMQEMEAAIKEVDVYVCPSFGGSSLFITNLTGHPALCLPNGFRASNGTPTSITFTGKLFGETALLSAGMAYQAATDFHKKRPPMAI